MSATPSFIFFTSELNDPGSSFDVFLGALGPPVARPRHLDKHPNLGNCGRSFRDLSVEINVSGKTHRANRGELVEGGVGCGENRYITAVLSGTRITDWDD